MKEIYCIKWNWSLAVVDSYPIIFSNSIDRIKEICNELNNIDQRDQLLMALNKYNAVVPELAMILLEQHPTAGIITSFYIDSCTLV